ncbi:MAG: ATP-dependent helicase HrpB [Bacteroidetes bacterium]|jgi:ATP-dependent helicase HrpB|nr:ATP-dependent helicase HrpB [Bacteroidota bacterium]
MPELPVDDVLPDLKRALRRSSHAVLEAPTGAGKTTGVPPALLDEPWLADQRIIMLEPRRLAARAAARRMASMRGERAGQTVGYRVRMDTRVSDRTRIEVVTEGVLTRMIQSDPALDGVGLVIFDEFHERNLQADLGLALALETQSVLREDLRLLVMSATLDGQSVADVLGNAPRVVSEGRSYPVETHYLDRRPRGPIEPHVTSAVHDALAAHDGDVLVFLPGAGEIRRVENQLDDDGVPPDVRVHPLYGNLPHKKQDEAIAPSPEGQRKVVLATPIAETSLTIEGIRVVIDSGLMRVPRFAPRSGMTRLETIKVSTASADQRKGRAGRLGPGVCYRLWTRHTQQHLKPHTAPEIAEADLAPLALDLAQWGTDDPSTLTWLTPPPEAAFDQARDLLHRLDALDADGQITEHGQAMAEFGLHPRLAHMVLNGQTLGQGALACDLAALLSERDVFKGQGGPPDVDLRLRLQTMQDARRGDRMAPEFSHGFYVDRGAVRRVIRVADHWRRKLGVSDRATPDVEACGLLVAFAYPDRIAQRRTGQAGQFRLRNGRAAALPRPQLLSDADYLVAAHLDGRRRESRVFLAAPIALDTLRDYFGDQIQEDEHVAWDSGAQLVRARRQERLGALVLKDGPLPDPPPAALAEAMTEGVRSEGLDLLPWTKTARRLQQRLVFLHHHDGGWPDVSDETLRATLDEWLQPHLYGMKRAEELQQLHLTELLKERLTWKQRDRLDELAPSHLTVPSGSRRPIDYSTPEAPVLAVRLQELFGATETPRIAGGRVPLTLHLLSPAQRPVQITQDLANFWDETYFEVKKDMKGRYPKHYWPDDPLSATPTNRVRPEGH